MFMHAKYKSVLALVIKRASLKANNINIPDVLLLLASRRFHNKLHPYYLVAAPEQYNRDALL